MEHFWITQELVAEPFFRLAMRGRRPRIWMISGFWRCLREYRDDSRRYRPRDTPLLPEATARALGAKLRGRRLLNISRGASSAFDVLLEMFRPARLVNVDVDAAAHSRIVVPEPPSIFDAAFLFGLLPECITQDSHLLKDAAAC